MIDFFICNIFPNWMQNLGLIATLFGFYLTIRIARKTGELYKLYNSKISSFYIVDRISIVYTKYSNKIKGIDKNTFKDDINEKESFFKLINEVNGIIATIDNNQPINKHIDTFSEKIGNVLHRSIDSLTYDDVWEYYNQLTKLNEILKNIQDMNARRFTP